MISKGYVTAMRFVLRKKRGFSYARFAFQENESRFQGAKSIIECAKDTMGFHPVFSVDRKKMAERVTKVIEEAQIPKDIGGPDRRADDGPANDMVQ